MVLKMDQRCAYASKPFVPDHSPLPWIGLSSGALDRLWFLQLDIILVKSHVLLTLNQLAGITAAKVLAMTLYPRVVG